MTEPEFLNQCFNCSHFRNKYRDCIMIQVNIKDLSTVIHLLEYVYPESTLLAEEAEKTNQIIKHAVYRLLEINSMNVNDDKLNRLIKYKRDIESYPQGHDTIENWTEIVEFFKCKCFIKNNRSDEK